MSEVIWILNKKIARTGRITSQEKEVILPQEKEVVFKNNSVVKLSQVDRLLKFLEDVAQIRLASYAYQVLSVIAYFIYSSGEDSYMVSKAEFCRRTGLTSTVVYKSIKELSGRCVIVENEIKPGRFAYSLQEDNTKWIYNSPQLTKKVEEEEVSTRNDGEVFKFLRRKLIASLVGYFQNLYKIKFNTAYIPHKSKDYAILGYLLKNLSPEEIRKRMSVFFKYESAFVKKAGYSIGVFSSQINKLSSTSHIGDPLLESALLREEKRKDKERRKQEALEEIKREQKLKERK